MQKHISQIAKRRISDFFTSEDGHVPRKNALAAGAVVSGTMLAAMMLVPDTAHAGWCGGGEHPVWCSTSPPVETCCSNCDWPLPGGEKEWTFFCVVGDCPPQNPGC